MNEELVSFRHRADRSVISSSRNQSVIFLDKLIRRCKNKTLMRCKLIKFIEKYEKP